MGELAGKTVAPAKEPKLGKLCEARINGTLHRGKLAYLRDGYYEIFDGNSYIGSNESISPLCMVDEEHFNKLRSGILKIRK